MVDQPRYVMRKVNTIGLDVHPTDSAIVVYYEIDASIIGEDQREIVGDVNTCQKIIRIPALSNSSKIPALAEQIMHKCSYIRPDQRLQLEQLLLYLQQRNEGKSKDELDREATMARAQRHMLEDGSADIKASLRDVDDYLERLYDDGQQKLMGSKYILQLARNPDNLEELVQNEAFMQALSRIIREEGMRNPELQTNLLTVFYFFSSFSQFHEIISSYKIGATCLRVVEHEIKREALWRSDLAKRMKRVKAEKMTQEDYDKYADKIAENKFKQEQLLYVAFHLLLNLAENQDTEQKMVKKGIVERLVHMLDRHNHEFLVLMVTFLKRLSIHKENKDKMAELEVVPKLVRLIPHENATLETVTLRLLVNLSFDMRLRARMVEVGLLPKLSGLLQQEDQPNLASIIIVLYHISMDDKHKPLFAGTEVIPVVMRLMLTCPEDNVELEPVSLAINLAKDQKCAALMSDGKGLALLLKRALKTKDPLLLKLVRNLCSHPHSKDRLLDFIDPLAQHVHESADDPDMLVELLGILNSLDIPDFDYLQLVEEYTLLPLLQRLLTPGAAEDDLFLEAVIMVGTILTDPACAPQVAECGIASQLVGMLKDKQEDDEIVLQIVYVWNKLLYYSSTRAVVLSEPQAVLYLLDLMHDQNDIIRKVCNSALDIVAECDESWASEIRMRQFQVHNAGWIEAVFGTGDEPLPEGELYYDEEMHDDDFLRYQNVQDIDDVNYDENDEGDLFIDEEDEDRYNGGRSVPLPFDEDLPDDHPRGSDDHYDDGGLWD
ncbi:hypothetical protein PTSG_11792 [Salpingoeca rosetta]|uniref:Kinesin-associated protein 3 n=1 Tax=Salpingoeca rosetta (strain ATCC 50818 / BSB-021) TaxID=946362 RepID=F2TZ61_SALR5|nr:uncharacterized protein PTSG_11792 [Salpingoeca rosetta]EGD78885.1 hypothetical protein PTSG_11792 [Salpingoeca rosetta]|eukprot:XP_004997841.1 hypothetical protein PTSG_11792 [Salpingoeca rosetta]